MNAGRLTGAKVRKLAVANVLWTHACHSGVLVAPSTAHHHGNRKWSQTIDTLGPATYYQYRPWQRLQYFLLPSAQHTSEHRKKKWFRRLCCAYVELVLEEEVDARWRAPIERNWTRPLRTQRLLSSWRSLEIAFHLAFKAQKEGWKLRPSVAKAARLFRRGPRKLLQLASIASSVGQQAKRFGLFCASNVTPRRRDQLVAQSISNFNVFKSKPEQYHERIPQLRRPKVGTFNL